MTRKLVAIAITLAVLAGAGCTPKTVEVQTGTQVVCTYGEIVSDDVRTIQVPKKDAGDYSVETSIVTCPLHRKLEELYAKAQAAIAAGDLKAARAQLADVLAADPSFRNAKQQADAIDRGEKPPASGGTSGGTEPTATPSGPAVNLTKYVPDSIAGYSAQALVSDALAVSRLYLPASAGAADQLVIAAEQFKDAKQAGGKVTSQVKASYPGDAAAVKVAGRDAYFGTNGRGFAVVGVADGSALVVFEMHAAKGAAKDLKAALLAVAESVL